ncbi:ABC transporter permease subunit [candidate division WOR-3 bacterium]|nr:ABC transporter permease subunit [candidate division WOR-3 bacterium]
MNKIRALTVVTVKALLREKTLWFILIFPLLMSLTPIILKPLVLGEFEKILYDFANSTFLLTGILLSVVSGTSVIQAELKQKTIYLLLSKPVRKEQYLLGKFFGMYASVFIVELAVAFLFLAVFLLTGSSLHPNFFLTFAFVQLQLIIVCALSVFFFTFTTPITGAVFTFLTVVSGLMLSSALNFSDISDKLNPLTKTMVSFIGYFLPAFSEIDINILAYHRIPLGADFILASVSYAFFYSLSCLSLSFLIFERREFL